MLANKSTLGQIFSHISWETYRREFVRSFYCLRFQELFVKRGVFLEQSRSHGHLVIIGHIRERSEQFRFPLFVAGSGYQFRELAAWVQLGQAGTVTAIRETTNTYTYFHQDFPLSEHRDDEGHCVEKKLFALLADGLQSSNEHVDVRDIISHFAWAAAAAFRHDARL